MSIDNPNFLPLSNRVSLQIIQIILSRCRVEHRRSKFRLRTFRFQPFRLLVPKSLKPYPCFLYPL